MKKRLGKFLFRIARIKAMGSLVGFVVAYFPFLIPIKKIRQSRFAVSIKHPVASYPDHVLIIPRKLARNVFCLSADDFVQVIDMAEEIRSKDDGDFALLINGGNRQDVMQAHFHLFSGNMVMKKGLPYEAGKAFVTQDIHFWEQIIPNLRGVLKDNAVTEESFSVLIQFEKSVNPSVYFI